jgi:hypothetical protein
MKTLCLSLAAVLLVASCRGQETSDRRAGRGMVRSSEHRGRPLVIPTPERAHQPAAGTVNTESRELPRSASAGSIEGKLLRRGARDLSLQTSDGRQVDLELDGAVHVRRGHSGISASQLREGSLVRAGYEVRAGTRVVTELELLQDKP